MSVLSALQSASIRLVGEKPAVFFGSSGQTEIELCDLLNEVARDILDFADWQGLTKIATISGDGETADFDFPADYSRQLLRSDMLDASSWFWG